MTTAQVSEWAGCYDLQWSGFITKQSFAHPAKFSRGLIERIYDYMLQNERVSPGDVVGDPFGGVATGGIIAAYRGLNWIGVELEENFVNLGRGNINLHRGKLTYLTRPLPQLIQGDSRSFDLIVKAHAIVTSPPYAATSGQGGGGINIKGYVPAEGRKWTGDKADPVGARTYQGQGANRTEGNIETLKEGSIDAVVSSPPYAGIAAGAGGLNTKPPKHPGQQSGRSVDLSSQNADQRYGASEGQISKLTEGDVNAVVTSPPWGANCAGGVGAHKLKDPDKFAIEMSRLQRGHAASPEARRKQFSRAAEQVYGDSDGSIGKESAETYWQAMNLVYAATFRAIKPGGYIAVVVKDYVSKKQRVRLCDDTVRLLEHCGFEMVERVQAMLVSETQHKDLFTESGYRTQTRSRKSFFRRLAEKKGSPPINYEEVLFARVPTL